MKTKKVSKKIYGNPTSDHLKTMESDSPMIGIDASNIRIRVPPEIKSREEKSEVRSLLKSLESSENNQEFIKLADEDVVNLFMSFCQENGLYFDKEYYKNLVVDKNYFDELNELSQSSQKKQKQIEASDQINFDQFLEKYMAYDD